MPSFFFFIWNYEESYLFFMGWAMFSNISRVYFFFFNMQKIKSNFRIIFLKCFPVIYFWQIIYSFPIIFIYKRFNVWNSLFLDAIQFLYDLMQPLPHIENIYDHHFFGFIYVFFIQSGRINIWTTKFKRYLVTLIIQKLPWVKNKTTSCH